MLMLMMLFLLQDDASAYETINAQIFVDGERLDVVDIRVKGAQPYNFEVYSAGEVELVSLHEVAMIAPDPDSSQFIIDFLNGTQQRGRINALSFSAAVDTESGQRISWLLQNVERIHFVQGRQIRSCPQGHYEEYTINAFCPVCGQELNIGAHTEPEEKEPGLSPLNGLRLDSRDPSSSAVRR